MAGHKIKFNANGANPRCELTFGHTNVVHYWIYKFVQDDPNPILLSSDIVSEGQAPSIDLGGSAEDLYGSGITIVARFISPLIDAEGPENFASVTTKFLQSDEQAIGSPKTARMPLKGGVAAFEVSFVFSLA